MNIFLEVHSKLGPGLLESVYEKVICYELEKFGRCYTRHAVIPVVYDGIILDQGFKADIIVEKKLMIELKSVENIAPVNSKQLLTYMKLTGIKLGILVNFNVELIKDGIRRIVNNF